MRIVIKTKNSGRNYTTKWIVVQFPMSFNKIFTSFLKMVVDKYGADANSNNFYVKKTRQIFLLKLVGDRIIISFYCIVIL